MGGAEVFAVVHIAFAQVLHSAVAVPGSYPGNEGTAAVAAGEKSCVAVSCGIATVGSGICFEQCLHLSPFCRLDDYRVVPFVAVLLRFGNIGHGTVMGFCLVIDQHTGVAFIGKDILDALVCPAVYLPARFSPPFITELLGCLALHGVEPSGDLFLSQTFTI